jgi:hypothetical protein
MCKITPPHNFIFLKINARHQKPAAFYTDSTFIEMGSKGCFGKSYGQKAKQILNFSDFELFLRFFAYNFLKQFLNLYQRI